eukprot:maker-scaffold336_size202805-snap-gene-1.38 protein:Tk02908 transcript:maker-scaffold336_size202805-snap-gene-1.38-mRNA-1 annotation:"hypothetical protein Phum_PHUM521410"
MLLPKLSLDRNECVLFHGGHIYCSCGVRFADVEDIENHYVRHDLPSGPAQPSRPVAPVVVAQELAAMAQRILDHRWIQAPPLSRLTVPPNLVYVLASEDQLDVTPMGAMACPACGEDCGNFSILEEHFRLFHREQWQPDLDHPTSQRIVQENPKIKRKGFTYHYFCPIPKCKYHILQNDPQQPTPLLSRKLLKQHYSKVHSKKDQCCPECDRTFSNATLLSRHQRECGKIFQCLVCSASYPSLATLQTHGRRKNHLVVGKKDCQLSRLGIGEKALPYASDASGLVKIAPRPSHHHLKAALALSELSTSQNFAAKVDRGIQKDFDPRPQPGGSSGGVKRSAETQTSRSSPSKQKPTSFWSPLPVVALPTEEQETQTPTRSVFRHNEIPFSDDDPLTFGEGRALWGPANSSSTQTSPKESQTLIKDCLLPSHGLELRSSATQAGSTPTESGHTSRAPKLADIEQFSTETQTDFVAQAVGVTTSTDWDLSFEQLDAGTQFDLDDILCSNYTQTGLDELVLVSSGPLGPLGVDVEAISVVHSIETQTMLP